MRVPGECDGAFVGRQAELERVATALDEHRLVTLTGVGGVGKSRLARAYVDQGEGAGFDTTCWADLWPLCDDTLLAATVADACDLADHTPRTPVEAVSSWIGDRRLLLVLDSCEHLVVACRSLLSDLFTVCPQLRVLVTSREPLSLPGERVIRVDPLPMDAAVDLLANRAAELGRPPSTDEDLRCVRELCERFEGIPLALELAAAHLRDHAVQDLMRHARDRLDLPDRNEWCAPVWHRALRTAVGWSHELCEPSQRLLWARLSVLCGPFDVETAQAVCAGGPLSASDVRRCLAALVDKSVVLRDQHRYRMLDTLREYGQLWLGELGERDQAAARHADHHLQQARLADSEWFGPQQAPWYGKIAGLYPDLCAALEYLLDRRPEDALELAGHIGFFWTCCGHLHEAQSYLKRALEATAGTSSHLGSVRTRARWALGLTHILQGRYDAGGEMAAACLVQARREGDPRAVLHATYLLGLSNLLEGHAQRALSLVDDALAVASSRDTATQQGAMMMCRLVRVFALTGTNQLLCADREAKLLRDECADAGEHWTRSYVDYQLSVIALMQERYEQAVTHARSMLTSKRQIGDSFGIALGLDILSAALAGCGQAEQAALAYGVGQRYWQSVGHPQRGTPEIGPLRVRGERVARQVMGDEAYGRSYEQAAQAEPTVMLNRLVTQASDS
ncbi:regulator [Streptomyces beijiangensis]|uniref:Regulator n=2 Tax=Streptomyces beijiangensis TaxID=163361 RepID=A0A939FAS1_9ACTN|nr:regulator [Streptomyces beijiangensis]